MGLNLDNALQGLHSAKLKLISCFKQGARALTCPQALTVKPTAIFLLIIGNIFKVVVNNNLYMVS